MNNLREERGRCVRLNVESTIITPDDVELPAFSIDVEWWGISGTDIAIPFIEFDYKNGRLQRDTSTSGRLNDSVEDVRVSYTLHRTGDCDRVVMDLSRNDNGDGGDDADLKTAVINKKLIAYALAISSLVLSLLLLASWLLIRSS